MSKLPSLSVQTRLFVVFGLLVLAAAVIAVIGLINAARFQEQLASLEASALALERAGRARSDLAQEQIATRNALLSDDARDWGQVFTHYGQFIDFVDSEKLAARSPAEQQALQEIADLRRRLDDQVTQVFSQIYASDYDPQAVLENYQQNAHPLAADLNDRLAAFSTLHLEQIAAQAEAVQASVRAITYASLFIILALSVLLVMGVYATYQIINPLNAMTAAIVAFQNDTYRPEMLSYHLARRDELGQLARAIDQMAASITESNRLKDIFLKSAARFIPLQYLEFLEKPAITDVNLGDHVAAEMTVMFSDIRGFTTASEKMTPAENFEFINAYLKLISPVIQQHDGFVVKFLGDGMMAIFPYGVADAVEAGIEKQRKVGLFNAMLVERGYQAVSVGIGIHTGPMMVGMIGEERRMQGDAFSDNVNLTSRVEGLNKFFGTAMIITAEVLEALPQAGAYPLRYLGQVQVKGRQAPLGLYEVLAGLPEEVITRRQAGQADFARGVQLFTAGCIDEAGQAFQAALQNDPADRATRLYLDRCAECTMRPVPADWSGVLVMTDK